MKMQDDTWAVRGYLTVSRGPERRCFDADSALNTGVRAAFNGFNYCRTHLYIPYMCVVVRRPTTVSAMKNDTSYKLALPFIKTRRRERIYTAVSPALTGAHDLARAVE